MKLKKKGKKKRKIKESKLRIFLSFHGKWFFKSQIPERSYSVRNVHPEF